MHKGLLALMQNPDIFKEDNAVEELGVGRNMVDSLRYWLKALQLTETVDDEAGEYLTKIGETVLACDPYFELDGTLLLCHYLLASNEDDATTWYWYFNKFGASEFDVDTMQVVLSTFVHNKLGKNINENTLRKDLNCLLRMYREPDYRNRETPETENPSPFVKYRLIETDNHKYYRRKVNIDDIDPLIFVYLNHLYISKNLPNAKSVNLDEIVSKEESPSLLLGLNIEDTVQLIEKVMAQHKDKYLSYNRTGGYNIIVPKRAAMEEALNDYYAKNSERGEL